MHYGTPPQHIARGLLKLKERIAAANIPASQLDESLNVATWNIREFGKKRRLKASLYYIAEILNQFDLIALTELRTDMTELRRVMGILGPDWNVVYSDFIDDHGGNKERIAYLFDTRMVRFTGLAAEANPPRKKNTRTAEYETVRGWWRAPYLASFESGSFDFVVITAHMRWGKSVKERAAALKLLGDWIEARRNHPHVTDTDFIVMGDFNIPSRRSSTYRALTGGGKNLLLPAGLIGIKGTNLSQKNTYDQILHGPTAHDRFSGHGGVLDFYRGDWRALYPSPGPRPRTKQKFTYELSDHLPLWLQVKTDISAQYLKTIAAV